MIARNEQTRPSRCDALSSLLDGLDDIKGLRGAASLRRLASQGNAVEALVHEARANAWALDELWDLGHALEQLDDHEDTVSRLSELDDLADDLDRLVAALRDVRRHREELEDAATEAWAATEGPS